MYVCINVLKVVVAFTFADHSFSLQLVFVKVIFLFNFVFIKNINHLAKK
jgi:hypothetical protein